MQSWWLAYLFAEIKSRLPQKALDMLVLYNIVSYNDFDDQVLL